MFTNLQPQITSGIANNTITRNTNVPVGDAQYENLLFLLSFQAGSVATGNLQIFVQDSVDGVIWDDLVSSNVFAFGAVASQQRFFVPGLFTPQTMTGTTLAAITQGSAPQQEALAAGACRIGAFGNLLRVREKVSGIAGSPVGVSYNIVIASR